MIVKLRQLYLLSKPGIVYANLLTGLAGYFVASRLKIDKLPVLVSFILATSLIIASAAGINNLLDRQIDRKMKRTLWREQAIMNIGSRLLWLIAIIEALVGFGLLVWQTNSWVVSAGLIGFLGYIGPYSYFKKRFRFSTLIGTIPGAMSILAGFYVIRPGMSLESIYLVLILIFWQLAHFYAISLFRRQDYLEANVPILSLKKSSLDIGLRISLYSLLMGLVGLGLITDKLNSFFIIALLIINLFWFTYNLANLVINKTDKLKAARKSFFFSLLVICLYCLLLPLASRY